jgi:hypothetical protein
MVKKSEKSESYDARDVALIAASRMLSESLGRAHATQIHSAGLGVEAANVLRLSCDYVASKVRSTRARCCSSKREPHIQALRKRSSKYGMRRLAWSGNSMRQWRFENTRDSSRTRHCVVELNAQRRAFAS